MTVNIDFAKDDLVAVWFVEFGGNHGNWLLTVLERPQGGFNAETRFRWYNDDKAFDSADQKIGRSLQSRPNESRASMMRNCRAAAAALARKSSGEMWELVRGAGEDNKAFMKRFMALPFVHVKTVSKDDEPK